MSLLSDVVAVLERAEHPITLDRRLKYLQALQKSRSSANID